MHLIVGGGIAGLSLAFSMYERNIPFKLIDAKKNYSSIVAAGLINPIVFRRTTKSWRVDEFTPYLESFYKKIEALVGLNFFHPISIRRIFAHEQERNEWEKKQLQPEYSSYLNEISTEDNTFSNPKNNFGTGTIERAYYVSTVTFMEQAYRFLEENNFIQYEEVNYSDFDTTTTSYKDEVYEKIFFCQGYTNVENPWFGSLPIQCTKGETLTVHSTQLPKDVSLNLKCFVLPIGNQEFKVGATYDWNSTDLSITEKGKEQLEAHLKTLTDAPYTIIDQKAGIRPTVLDRRPLLGKHSEFPNLILFNGLGTKGYMMAPLLANELLDHVFNNSPLDPEVNIQRFEKEK
ncbi:MAG: FAD-binding oxidoreductase [Crocinitomicaceae bacterium]|nr:FAD-binding oxidoreductase [Crocinitomicaceae bacterium]